MEKGIRNMNIGSDIIPFTQLSIDVKKAITGEVSITVKLLNKTEKPSIGILSGKKVYGYLEVQKTKITDNDIEDILIQFKINRSWHKENKVGYDNVSLYRYTTKWIELPTIKSEIDDDYIYYNATSLGFSYFAIAEKNKEIINIKEEEKLGEETEIKEEIIEEKEEVPPIIPLKNDTNNTNTIFIILGIALIALLTLFLIIKRKK